MIKWKQVSMSAALALLLAGCSGNLPWNSDDNGAAVENDQQAAQTSAAPESDALNAEQAEVSPGENVSFYFPFDGNQLTPSAQTALDKQANYLLSHANARVRLEGNTDERGSHEYNVALGWRRARVVTQYLRHVGVPQSQLSALSYGKERPRDLGHNQIAWAHNRRADLVYTG